jgi:hypothetical protein
MRPFPECCPRSDQVVGHSRQTRNACATGVTSSTGSGALGVEKAEGVLGD